MSHTQEAVLRSVGAITLAVDLIMKNQSINAFCNVRPPGHHAEKDKSMGFCFFNNVVIGALYARKQYGLKKIAVIDFDVHHGNGTQCAFENDCDLFYASTHQSPCYPGTGALSEIVGIASNIVNEPICPDGGSDLLHIAFETKILPSLRAFAPDFIFISAGFDAHKLDPLADLYFENDDYYWMTKQLTELAAQICSSRVVSILEGGYNLVALGEASVEHVKALHEAGEIELQSRINVPEKIDFLQITQSNSLSNEEAKQNETETESKEHSEKLENKNNEVDSLINELKNLNIERTKHDQTASP